MRGERRYRDSPMSRHREEIFQDTMAIWRGVHGLARAVSTGPASREEVEEAHRSMGSPKTHEEWLEACKRARGEGTP